MSIPQIFCKFNLERSWSKDDQLYTNKSITGINHIKNKRGIHQDKI